MTLSYPQVSDLKEAVGGILTGINTNNIRDFNNKARRAAVKLLMQADVPEMMDVAAIDVFDRVYDYTPPATIFGSLIKDIRPQGVSRNSLDIPYKKPLQDFDVMKQRIWNGTLVTFEQRQVQQIMRLSQVNASQSILIDPMSQTTGWVAGGNASGLALDQTVYYESPGALRFNLAAAGAQGYIERTFTSQSDMTAYVGVGVVFIAIRLPSAAAVAAVTSIGIHLGNDSTHYWDVSATQGFLGAWTAGNFLLVALDLANAATTGSVDATKIDYARVYVNYNGTAIPNVYIGNIFVSLRSPNEIVFETPAIFVPIATTVPQKTITLNTDYVMLGDAAYALYCYEVAREVALGKGGTIASGLISGIDVVLDGKPGKIGLYSKFRADNPSDSLRSIGTWA